MKRWLIFLPGMMAMALNNAVAADLDAPRGSVLEWHSCELFAGGCVVSSESPQGGRYMVRAWQFTGGSYNGTGLAGLEVAALQVSSDNLATADAKSGDTIIYLPQSASQVQRDALVAWLNSNQLDSRRARFSTRVVPLKLERTADGYSFSAGDTISISTAPIERCSAFACGESLWYEPRTQTTVFTVAVDRSARIIEPWLQLKWSDSGKRSVFLARFGTQDAAKNLYVSLDELCGPAKRLF